MLTSLSLSLTVNYVWEGQWSILFPSVILSQDQIGKEGEKYKKK